MSQSAETIEGIEQKAFEDAEAATKIWRLMVPKAVDPERPLPTPTRDLEALKLDIDTHGYCFVAGAMPDDIRVAMKARYDEQIAAEKEIGRGLLPATKDDRITNLLNKGAIFQHCVTHPLVDEVLKHVLEDGFTLGLVGGVKTLPGSLAQGLHSDQAYIGFPTPVPLTVNTVWMLDDFTEEVGATRVIPGSHLWGPEQVEALHEGVAAAAGTGLKNPAGTIPAEAPAGTCMIFDARLLHGTGRNMSESKVRTGIFCYYGRGYMRTFENPFLSIDDEVMMTFSEELRAQLGYRPWFYFGGFEAPGMPAPLDVVRPKTRLGELTPKK